MVFLNLVNIYISKEMQRNICLFLLRLGYFDELIDLAHWCLEIDSILFQKIKKRSNINRIVWENQYEER